MKKFCSALLAGLALGMFASNALAQNQAGPKANVFPIPPFGVFPAIEPPREFNPDQFALHVQFDKRQGNKQEFQRISQLLTAAKLKPPQARIDYFKKVSAPKGPEIVGWSALITDIQSGDGFQVIRVAVSPNIGVGVDLRRVIETYVVTGDKIEFQSLTVPPQSPIVWFH